LYDTLHQHHYTHNYFFFHEEKKKLTAHLTNIFTEQITSTSIKTGRVMMA